MDTPKRTIDANDVIDRMKDVYGIAKDTVLGAALGVGSSTVSTWRRRNSVPYAECTDLALRRGVSLDWLVLGLDARHAGDVVQNAGATPGAPDPRVARIIGFIHAWRAGHVDDDVAWLERTLARSVPEYAEWLAANP